MLNTCTDQAGEPSSGSVAHRTGHCAEKPPTNATSARAVSAASSAWARSHPLGALRAVDRYGITRRGEQYAGFRALEAGAGHPFRTPAGDEDLVEDIRAQRLLGPDQAAMLLAIVLRTAEKG
ncbi:MAG: hypothetical protein ACRDTG_29045 [Pseudonocardiaceae bacterium]